MLSLTISRNDGGAPIEVSADVIELAINEPVSSLTNLNEVLLQLPNLEHLVFYVTDYGKVDSTTSLSFLQGLKRLKSLVLCSMPHLRECAPLHECRMLESLDLNRHVTKVFDFSVLPAIPSLRALSLEMPSDAILEKASKISQLKSLEASGGFKLPSLRPLSNLAKLRRLRLWSGSLTSTDGLAGFTELEDLNLGHSKLKDTRELGRVTGLKKLELRGNKAVSNLDFLENGALELLGLYEIPNLDSLKPILRLSRLKEIQLSAKIADGDLLPLGKCVWGVHNPGIVCR
jgi:hypothetical protein